MDADEDVTTAAEGVEPSSSKPSTPPPGDEGMAVDSPQGKPSSSSSANKVKVIPQSKVARAAHLALNASAKAARTLADTEDTQIRAVLSELVRLTLQKIELKMSQFEELEEVLEDERRNLESARVALAEERATLSRTLENVKSELQRHQSTVAAGEPSDPMALQAAALGASMGTSGQGTMLAPVPPGTTMEEANGPINDGSFTNLT